MYYENLMDFLFKKLYNFNFHFRKKETKESDVMDLLKTILVSVFAFIIVVLLLAFICVWRSKCP